MHINTIEAIMLGGAATAICHYARAMLTILNNRMGINKRGQSREEKITEALSIFEPDSNSIKYIERQRFIDRTIPITVAILGFASCIASYTSNLPEFVLAFSIPTLQNGAVYIKNQFSK